MANFFQPGPTEISGSATPSPADQARQKFQVEMLGRILSSMAGTAPSFASFAAGGPAQRSFPGGFEGDIASLLGAMNEPGAFTSQVTRTGQGPTPSGVSDIVALLAMLTQLDTLTGGVGSSKIGTWLQSLGGAKGIGGVNPALGDFTPTPDFLSSLPSGDVPGVNFTPDPSLGMTMDPNAGIPPDMSWLTTY